MKKAQLKEWFIKDLGDKYVLVGKIFGHPDFTDGTMVTTSSVQEVITRNTIYLLKKEDKLFKD